MKNLLNKKEIPSSADYTIVALKEDGNVTVKGGTPTPPTYEMVDLGLPSGLKWANMNVGATSETDYGKYFMWGDVKGRYRGDTTIPCDWLHTPLNGGSSSYNSSYFASVSGDACPNGVLASQYDAAHVNMGGNWRMPTQADFEELCYKTKVTWESDFNGSGVNGRKFTSETDETKYIFIPAAGWSHEGAWTSVGYDGFVWSSSIRSSGPGRAFGLNFHSGGVYPENNDLRYYGMSVRGVC